VTLELFKPLSGYTFVRFARECANGKVLARKTITITEGEGMP
jgi:hypothetical protein